MKKIFILFAVFLSCAGASLAQQQSDNLVNRLPVSDAVMTVNLKRLRTEAAPQLLVSKPEKLAALESTFEEMRAKTGIDFRQFEQIAVGATMKNLSNGKVEIEPVALLRGSYNADALLLAVKLASSDKFRQEKIGDKTITIFNVSDAARTTVGASKNDVFDKMLRQFMRGEIAIAGVDANTLAFGKPAKVRQMLSEKSPKSPNLAPELNAFLNRNPNALMNLAGNFGGGFGSVMQTGLSEIDDNIMSVRQVFGTIDLSNGNGSLLFSARAARASDAAKIEDLLGQMIELGKGFLSVKQTAKNEALSKMLDKVKITRDQSDVQLKLEVPQNDLAQIVNLFL
jgi:hypothetical protein